MKVILLAPTPPPRGGIAGWTVRMKEAKFKNNWQVVVVDEKTDRANAYSPIGSLSSEVKRCFRIWNDLKKALKDEDVKVVHSCIPATTTAMLREYICACITKRNHRKFIIHFRCTVPNMVKSFWGRFMLKRLCNKSDLIMTLNQQTNSFIREMTKTPYKLIPNFISENEVIAEKAIRQNLNTVVYVGGVIKTKGAFDLLTVAQKVPDVVFRCFGSVDIDVQEYYKTLNINNVVFEGEQPREVVKQALYDADIFAFLSYFPGEGFSNALCEAMAAGLPCVVTDWAANADMIENRGGIVVPVRDPQAAVVALEKMRQYDVRRTQS